MFAGSLDDVMTTALVEDKVDFVRLLLQNGLVMKEYLTVPQLRKLYCLVRILICFMALTVDLVSTPLAAIH